MTHLFNISIDIQMSLNNFHYIPLNYKLATSRYFVLSTGLLFILLMQSVSGVQFLHIHCSLLLSACLAATSVPAPAIVLVPFNVSLQRQRLDFNIAVLNLI